MPLKHRNAFLLSSTLIYSKTIQITTLHEYFPKPHGNVPSISLIDIMEIGSEATIAVFNTAELAEWILEYLNVRDLLTALRISRRFKNVIQSSRKLQQKLFLSPLKPHTSSGPGSLTTHLSLSPEQAVVAVNTIFGEVERILRPDYSAVFEFDLVALLGLLERHPRGSWKEMFLTQPAAVEIEIYHNVALNNLPKGLWFKRYGGLKMKHLIDDLCTPMVLHRQDMNHAERAGVCEAELVVRKILL